MSAGSKIAMGAIILAGAGLAVLGLHDVGAGLINTFNSASHHAASPEAQMMIKGAAVIGGGLVGAIGGGVAGATIHREQELGVIPYVLAYAAIVGILGAFGGHSLADRWLGHSSETPSAVVQQATPSAPLQAPKLTQ
ncbi:MAG TPA: hypothetical protein VL625_13260 [Patescibacteria group bacterium]|jgi:hypothetical protein|nr:hypothetical protein [Patescibacteria group bacterium]